LPGNITAGEPITKKRGGKKNKRLPKKSATSPLCDNTSQQAASKIQHIAYFF
jgi:hypothetical protein